MTFILLFLGFIIGGFVIIMGGGGAALYLGILTSLIGVSPATAAATSLYTSIPSLLIGSYSHYRTGNMKFKYGNRMLITAVPFTIIGSILSKFIPEIVYSWLIFIVFFTLGVQVLYQSFHPSKKQKHLNPKVAYFYGTLSGLMVGIAGMSGGGPIVSGLLVMGLTMQEAAATSSYILIITSIVGFLSHASTGHVAWYAGTMLLIGAIIGAAIMPYLLSKYDPNKVTRVLRPIMGIIMIIMAFTSI
ncbi:sulfite exporter TauE/SafE family protein [Apilactobacillus micheneri]|uniref:sulfite exporter TauE/SafE family protein n=1 Tax=Apilactobacillus micheneri TaxID=1899430 RepID=UPI00112A87AD|nr:sulfite exporter TauE/SafE family protein [Apilactobacillus micheneri]TPR38884.1 sulfite exporter TauE/SafE family protein [Apilactobacillus micheneri]